MVKVSGGNQLAKRLAEIGQALAKAKTVEIGFLEGATYPDGTSVAMVAAIDEFGSGNKVSHKVARALGMKAPAPVPPRPFFRGMIQEKSPEWPGAVANLLVANNYDADKTLGQTGAAVKGQLQAAITTYVGPPLKPSTIARKGHDKQLVDSSNMLNSVDYAVKS